MRFAFILAERACWPVAVMCAVLKVSASGFYAWLRSVPSARARKDERLKVLIGESFARSRQRLPDDFPALMARVRRTDDVLCVLCTGHLVDPHPPFILPAP